jgi:hypothetical protein
MIYQFKSGHVYHGVDAQTAGEELERIRVLHGGKLKPDDILKSARATNSPIHGVFTWDDKRAAHQYRLSEARQLVRALVTVNERGAEAPAFWNIIVSPSKAIESGDAERYYQAASVIASSPHEYEAALRVMVTELAAAQSGLEKLRALAPKGSKIRVMKASKLVESASKVLQ